MSRPTYRSRFLEMIRCAQRAAPGAIANVHRERPGEPELVIWENGIATKRVPLTPAAALALGTNLVNEARDGFQRELYRLNCELGDLRARIPGAREG